VTDIVVAGSGAAGLTAALVAADEGADVLVLERSPLVGGATAVSGGTIWIPANHHEPEVGVEDSRADAERYMRAVSGGAIDEDVLATLLDLGPEMVRFLEERTALRFEAYPPVGPTLDYRFQLDGARRGGRSLSPSTLRLSELGEWADRLRQGSTAGWVNDKDAYYTTRAYLRRPGHGPAPPDLEAGVVGTGTALVGHLLKGCLDRGVRVRVDARVEQLVLEDGVVTGVRAAGETLDARAGVVLATGGFEWNDGLKRRLLARPLTHPATPPVSHGDGLVLGLSVGADVSGLGDAWWSPTIDLRGAPSPRGGGTVNLMCRTERGFPHSLVVNRHGRRFVNEALNYYDLPEAFGTLASGPENLPAWLVLDRQFRDSYPVVGARSNGIDQPDPAWIVWSDTLAGLARAVGIDPDGLERTVARFNAFAREGVDRDFGRGATEWDREWGDPEHVPNPSLGTIERAPFYAIELHAGAIGTKGGLRVNGRGEVVAAAGGSVPGLYAAGNVAAGAVPWGYTGPGATIGPGMTFGYAIGRELARRLSRARSRTPA
jgi:succinate dehydrogenase/fumarate reductase flavoprotein subunit